MRLGWISKGSNTVREPKKQALWKHESDKTIIWLMLATGCRNN
jgi:hypothetical protein